MAGEPFREGSERFMRRIAHLRWWIVGLICAGTIANYLARNSLGVLAPELKTVMHMTTEQYSYVVGGFQLAYTVMQPIAGMVVDRIGLRAGFALFGAAWSVANMLHALAAGWLGLMFFRGLLGMFESAAIPSGIKAIAEWFPARERSVAVGWFNAGTSLNLLQNRVVGSYAINWDISQAAILNQGGTVTYLAQCCGIQLEYQRFSETVRHSSRGLS